MIIELRFSPDQSRKINHLAAGRGFGEGQVLREGQQGAFGYLNASTFQALKLPYQGSELSMIVFLPRTAHCLAEFERTLTVGRLIDWLADDTALVAASARCKDSPRLSLSGGNPWEPIGTWSITTDVAR